MRLHFAKIVSLLVVAAAAGLSLWGHFHLPDVPVATHFDLSGHVNGHMPRDMALIFGPALCLVMAVGLLWVLPVVMPKSASLERSSDAYGAIVAMTVLFLGLVHALIVARAFGIVFDMFTILVVGIGLLFIVIGNYLPKTRYNYVLGLRNPWTLSDERVWDRTHRLAGPLFMLSGLAMIAAAFVVPQAWQIVTMTGIAVAAALLSHIYAYVTAQRFKLV